MTPTMTLPGFLPPSSMFIVNCVSYSGVVFQTYEWLDGLPFEAEHIWSKPASSGVKWRYLCSRYLGFIGHLTWCIFYTRIQVADTVPLAWCRSFHWTQVFVSQIIILSLHVSVRQRLIAQHKRRPKIAAFLNILTAMEFVISAFWGPMLSQRMEVLGACLIQRIPYDAIYLFLLRLVIKGIFCASSLPKIKARKTLLPRLAFKDGSTVFGVIFLAFSSLLTNSHLSKFDFNFTTFYQCTFPVALVILSSAGCHIIRNTEQVDDRHEDTGIRSAVELIPFISLQRLE